MSKPDSWVGLTTNSLDNPLESSAGARGASQQALLATQQATAPMSLTSWDRYQLLQAAQNAAFQSGDAHEYALADAPGLAQHYHRQARLLHTQAARDHLRLSRASKDPTVIECHRAAARLHDEAARINHDAAEQYQ